MQIRQRSSHLLDDRPESALMLGVTPTGIVATACFVMEQSDRRQFHILVQSESAVPLGICR
jgi:hypothetical protein